jgi:hypothetical protein
MTRRTRKALKAISSKDSAAIKKLGGSFDLLIRVPDAGQKDLLGIIGTLKNDIVENK